MKLEHISLLDLTKRLDEIENERNAILDEIDRRFPCMGRKIRYQEAEVKYTDEPISDVNVKAMEFNIKKRERDYER